MANPYNTKYQVNTERVPLVGNYTNRLASASKDQVFYNVIPEVIENKITGTKKIWLNKRGAFVADTTVVGGGGAARAIFYWPVSGKTYSIVADKLYSNSSAIQTLTTSTGTCWIVEFKGTANQLVISDGTKMYTVSTTDVVVEITDVDKPAGAICPVFFDGYIFVIKSGTDQIWNSDVDDPTAWTNTSFLSAEQYSDNLVALIRQVNYVVAFGLYSTEFFYDAASASGSPLRRQESVSLKVGLAARDSVAQVDRRIYWIGQTQTGDPSVWSFEGLTASEVSIEPVRKILKNEGSNLTNATGYVCSHKGHTLYIINLNARTIVYDCNEKMWVDWSIYSAGSHAVLPFKYSAESSNNKSIFLHNTDGKFYSLDPATHTDDAGAILVDIVTDKVDFNSSAWKEQVSLTLVGDVQSSGTVTVSWSDDDYQNYRTSRSLDLTAGRAYTKAGGVFRRRSYRIQHSTNAPFRAESLELDYQMRVV
jgi:hypothetical protein